MNSVSAILFPKDLSINSLCSRYWFCLDL